jgi:hypothetical protein
MTTLDLLLLVLSTIAAALKVNLTGGAQKSDVMAQSAITIVQAGVAIYEKEAGKTIDPSLVKPIDPIV